MKESFAIDMLRSKNEEGRLSIHQTIHKETIFYLAGRKDKLPQAENLKL
jgi:hypothetical protein